MKDWALATAVAAGTMAVAVMVAVWRLHRAARAYRQATDVLRADVAAEEQLADTADDEAESEPVRELPRWDPASEYDGGTRASEQDAERMLEANGCLPPQGTAERAMVEHRRAYGDRWWTDDERDGRGTGGVA